MEFFHFSNNIAVLYVCIFFWFQILRFERKESGKDKLVQIFPTTKQKQVKNQNANMKKNGGEIQFLKEHATEVDMLVAINQRFCQYIHGIALKSTIDDIIRTENKWESNF